MNKSIRIVSDGDPFNVKCFDVDGVPMPLDGVVGIDIKLRGDAMPLATLQYTTAAFDIKAELRECAFSYAMYWRGKRFDALDEAGCKAALAWQVEEETTDPIYASMLIVFAALVRKRLSELALA
jgi:hypothetical protein